MGFLKRKRSESEFSFSSGSTFSSPPRPDSSNFNFGGMDSGMSSPIRYGVMPSHLPSRTLKRFRDNRLSEEEIHQNTLKMLYSAQQQRRDQPQHHEQMPQQAVPHSAFPSQPTIPSSTSSGQRSLHAFWNIPSAASRPDMLPPPVDKAALALTNKKTSCEDCGTMLSAHEGDTLMDIDGSPDVAAGASQCIACGKVVCCSCSVSNLGAEPRCLVCAGRDVRYRRAQWIAAC